MAVPHRMGLHPRNKGYQAVKKIHQVERIRESPDGRLLYVGVCGQVAKSRGKALQFMQFRQLPEDMRCKNCDKRA